MSVCPSVVPSSGPAPPDPLAEVLAALLTFLFTPSPLEEPSFFFIYTFPQYGGTTFSASLALAKLAILRGRRELSREIPLTVEPITIPFPSHLQAEPLTVVGTVNVAYLGIPPSQVPSLSGLIF